MITDPIRKSAAIALSTALALAAWPAWPVLAAEERDNPTIESLEVLPDQVVLHMTGAVSYKTRVIPNPPRILLQLEGAEYNAAAKSFAGKGALLKTVRAGQFSREPKLVSRVVLDLTRMAAYRIVKTDDGLRVELDAVVAKASQPAVAKPAAAKPAEVKPAEVKPAEVKPAVAVAMRDVPSDQVKKSSAAPVGNMNTEFNPELAEAASRSSVEGEGAPEASKRASAASSSASTRPERHGGDIISRLPTDLVSLDFDNTDIRDVLKLLGAKARINLIYGADISGNLTLHLVDVPFADAFRTALSMMNLMTIQVGDNILRVLPPGGARAQSQVGLMTKVIALNYQKASDMLTPVNQVRQAEGRSGTAVADAKTNSLIITESVDGMLATERLISQLDVRPQQVLIEAKLVEVNLSDSLNYGIQWDYSSIDVGRALGKFGTSTVGSIPGLPNPFVNPRQGLGLDNNSLTFNGVSQAGNIGAAGRGTGVSLPSDKVFGALTLGRITNNYLLSATLTAAASQGKVKVLSDPKVATLNNQAATINVQTQFPYVTSNVTATGVTSNNVTYVSVGITLSVTPTINADGRITLLVNPTVSQPSATAAANAQSGAPGIDTRNANTTVLVKDGETIVIGGLISDSVSDIVSKIPILGDIPLLGNLFKKRSKQRSRTELLIFVTPKIMD